MPRPGRNAGGMRKHYSREQRTKLIDLVAAGATVSQAAAQIGVTTATAYNWARAARARASTKRRDEQALLPPPTFVRLVRMDDEPAPLALRVGAVEIDVRAGFDAALLRAVVAALQGVGA
jgi:transposase-like protein